MEILYETLLLEVSSSLDKLIETPPIAFCCIWQEVVRRGCSIVARPAFMRQSMRYPNLYKPDLFVS
jgi:hypothetical protein